MTLNIKTNVVVDLPCTYSNNHLTTTAGTQSSVWLEFLTAALMWNCRHLLNPVNFGNSETICCCVGQFFFIPPSFLSSRTLAACFSPRPVHHLWVSPLVLLQHPFMLSPLSLSVTPCSADSCPLKQLPGCHALLFLWQPVGSVTFLRVTSQHSLLVNHSSYNWFTTLSEINRTMTASDKKMRCRERLVQSQNSLY